MALTPQEEEELIRLLEEQQKENEIKKAFTPQPGPQTAFLQSMADITIFGGSAGGGKTYAILLSAALDISNPKYGAVIFRREANQIFGEGGLWDTATSLYKLKGGVPVQTPRPTIRFPNGSKISFAHLQRTTDVQAWDGSQIALICMDELCHFERSQFIYMMSRNRSNSGARNRMIASCNPDANSFVAELVDWYIGDDGFPIPERSGVIRYFLVIDDQFHWGDSREELAIRYGMDENLVKSFTFIPSKVTDNKILLKNNPGYLASLNALGTVQKGRLLYGNWKIKESSGMFFKRGQAQIVTSVPGKIRRLCRAWDLAASIPTPDNNSPDATAGPLMGKLDNGKYIILGLEHGRWVSNDVRKLVKKTAEMDKARYGNKVTIRIPQDPGQAGKEQSQSYLQLLAGFIVKSKRVSGDKMTRAEPFASQWQAGNVLVLAGDWNDKLFTELEAFPPEKRGHDDIVDACSDAFAELVKGRSWAGAIT